jgi:hypothetical protein
MNQTKKKSSVTVKRQKIAAFDSQVESARGRLAAARQQAQRAKVELKRAKKAAKEAKRKVKAARKELKSLKRALKSATLAVISTHNPPLPKVPAAAGKKASPPRAPEAAAKPKPRQKRAETGRSKKTDGLPVNAPVGGGPKSDVSSAQRVASAAGGSATNESST